MRTEAEQARDEAMARVASRLTDDEMKVAIIAVGECATQRAELTTDDVVFDFPDDIDTRVSGVVMTRAAKEGFIKKTDRTVKSTSPTCHARDKRVWQSLIYQGAS